jgi:hypothetical protein
LYRKVAAPKRYFRSGGAGLERKAACGYTFRHKGGEDSLALIASAFLYRASPVYGTNRQSFGIGPYARYGRELRTLQGEGRTALDRRL